MSRWGKLLSWLGRRSEFDDSDASNAQLDPRGEPEATERLGAGVESTERVPSAEQQWLDHLAEAVAVGERIDDVGSPAFWNRVNDMWRHGEERLVTQLVEKFIVIPVTPERTVLALRARLVEMLDNRGESSLSIKHLEALAGSDEYTVRANYLLAEHFRRLGNEVRALRHYEQVLARDVGYLNVKIRVDRLRQRRGQANRASLGETIVGPEAQSQGAGARYRLVRELGRGATAVVYLARDGELERDVAIKLLHPHLSAATKAESCARFFAEARIAASLRHPNIMAILDIDEKAKRIVLELAAGGTLRAVLRERGPRTMRRALERHVQVLSALGAAHRRGIVHRDLKPANLMFRRDPGEPGAEVILGDFGIAHLPDADGAEPERRDAVGTLAYMAPEQRRAEQADPKCDIYASAVVFYEMVVGKLPWSQDTLLRGVRVRGDFTLPTSLNQAVGGPTHELIAKVQVHLDNLGDPDPAHRPSTDEAAAQARELRDIAIAESAA